MLREKIKKDLAKAISNFQFPISNLDIEVTRSSDPKFGDYTTNVALQVSRKVKQFPLDFAKVLTDSLKDLPYVAKLEVAGPGFLNFWIKSEVWQDKVSDVLKAGEKYGSNYLGKGKKARVEFVSANPTGPLHFGNARGGPIGDVLASVLEFSGWQVLREYLHNDIGEQVRKLGESILNVANGAKLAEQEYKGEYIGELAEKIGKVKNSDEAGKRAVTMLFREILTDCQDMGIVYDETYPESDFIKRGLTAKALGKLGKYFKKQEGALWFVPNDQFLKDRECVVQKSDGNYTYFANDIAYHDLKFTDKPDLVIDVFGANHHGHVPRLQAAISALGYDVSKFRVILYQWVRFRRGGEKVAMSKRSGTFVTVREVLNEVGRDALRFLILMHDANTHIDFDLDLAKKKSAENPVYYVQYAHARIASILSKAKIGSRFTVHGSQSTNYQLLTTNYELDLIKKLTRLPELIEDIAQSLAVHSLTAYAIDLADSFHRFYENCRVIGENEDLMQARLGLVLATQIALSNTLALLGIEAPEKM